MFINPFKEKSNISVATGNELYVGDYFTVTLKDSNNAAISNQNVSITIGDIKYFVTTNNDGEASLKLDNLTPGNYNVSVVYPGNNKYSESSTNTNINIREITAVSSVSASGSAESSSNIREEDKVTPDGWDPKKHETYREKWVDGNERVHYDDGYTRIVDKDGNILSYGYSG